MMTTDEVLDYIHLNSKRGDWSVVCELYGIHHIRHVRTMECPLCWIASEKGVNPDRLIAAYHLVVEDAGIGPEVACDIAYAADSPTHELRSRLKAACHLVPEESS